MKDKLPFHSVDNMDIVSGSFNSNFSCKCLKTTNFVLGSESIFLTVKLILTKLTNLTVVTVIIVI